MWARFGIDVLLLALAGAVFWLAGQDNYTLVLAPEGVPAIAVSYWAFAGPALLWLGTGLLGWRLAELALGPGRGLVARLLRPLSGNLAGTVASILYRRRRVVARSAVLLGPGAVLRGVHGDVQRHLPAAGRGRRQADQRRRRHRHRITRRARRAGRGRRAGRRAGGAGGRAGAAPLRLRRRRPAGRLRGAAGHDHRGHRAAGRLLPGRQRPRADGHPRRAARLHPGQRGNRAGLPAAPRRPAQPAAAGRAERAAQHGAVPLRRRGERVPHGAEGQLLRGQRRLPGRQHRLRRRRRVPGRHRRPGHRRGRPSGSAACSGRARPSPTSGRRGAGSGPA